MRVPKIDVKRLGLGALMSEFEQGHIRVPRFQRDFVWKRVDILKLLDSMYNEYPIGTIFLWDAPASLNHLLRDIEELRQPPLSDKQGYKFILDGQQRLTSLYAVIKGLQIEDEDYRKIVVNLSNNDATRSSFVYHRPDNKNLVSVSDLLAYDIFEIYNNLPNDDHKKRFTEFRSALNDYPFSVVAVSDMEINDAIEIFERINRQGRKLTRYDLISASVSEFFDLRQRSEEDIINELKTDFGEIEETSIPQAVALNKKGRTDHDTQLNLTAEDIESVWDDTAKCFALAVDFVKKNLGVARKSFLPYDAILPILAHYFFRTGSGSINVFEHRRQLEHWFWQSAFSQRYTDKSQSRMNEDTGWIKQLVNDDKPFEPLTIANENDLIDSSMGRTTSAIRNGVLCLFNVKKPRHFINRMELDLGSNPLLKFTRAEKHHIFPAAFLKSKGFDARLVDSIPNFCFIPSDLNKQIGDRPPSEYMREIMNGYSSREEFEKVMRSHLIPAASDSAIWTDDYERFLMQRAKLIIEEIRQLCGITPRIEQEKLDPVVNAIETAIRDSIHHTLLAQNNLYWKYSIPGDVKRRVDNSIAKHVDRTPGSRKSQYDDPRKKLDFCDVSDYSKIIVRKDNWPRFSGVFKNRSECERVLDDFREFRAALKHNRDIESMLYHRAQAAIIWLSEALELDLSKN